MIIEAILTIISTIILNIIPTVNLPLDKIDTAFARIAPYVQTALYFFDVKTVLFIFSVSITLYAFRMIICILQNIKSSLPLL